MKLRARVARTVREADQVRVSEFLGEMIGVPFGDEVSGELRAARSDSLLMGDQVAVPEDFVGAECRAQTVLIVMEDLHWGDLPSVKLIDAALRNLHDEPLMVLALARPEVHELFPKLWAERELQEIRLASLTRKSAEKIVREALSDLAPDRVARLVARAAGNAFYLEELIRMAADGREEAPATVLAMVQSRLEVLAPEARRVLRAASVFGEVFWAGGVNVLLGGDEAGIDVRPWLDHLIDRELIAPRGDTGSREGEYIFRHALVRDSALAMLTDADRALGHSLAGAWLEQHGEGSAIVLAEHFDQGGDRGRALSLYIQAAEQALAANDLVMAVSRAERAVACGAAGEALARVRLVQAEAHKWLAAFELAEARAREAATLSETGTDLWYRAVSEAVTVAGRSGNSVLVSDLSHRLLEASEGATFSPIAMRALTGAVTQLVTIGAEDELSMRLLDRIEAIRAGAEIDPRLAGWLEEARATRAMLDDRLDGCLLHVEAAAAHFTAAGDLRNACVERGYAGWSCLELGQNARGEAALVKVIAASTKMGLSITTTVAKHNLSLLIARRGAFAEAAAMQREAVALFELAGDVRGQGGGYYYLAIIFDLAGDHDACAAAARVALEHLLPPTAPGAIALLARCELAAGRVDEGLRLARDADARLRALGFAEDGRTLTALVMVEALLASGDTDAAKLAMEHAVTTLHARAAKLTDPSMRATFLVNIPENAATLALATKLGVRPD